MLHDLFVEAAVGAQMIGVVMLLIGCLFVAGAIFSNRIGGFVKGAALIMVGSYLAGLGGNIPH